MAGIDRNLLPKRAMVDTTVFLRAMGAKPHDADSALCVEWWNEMRKAGHTILVSTPTIAEAMRGKNPIRMPHELGVEVVAFGLVAAELLGTKFPEDTLIRFRNQVEGTPLDYFKYDAIIVACALAAKADCLVTRERAGHGQARLAAIVNLPVVRVTDAAPQGLLPLG